MVLYDILINGLALSWYVRACIVCSATREITFFATKNTFYVRENTFYMRENTFLANVCP